MHLPYKTLKELVSETDDETIFLAMSKSTGEAVEDTRGALEPLLSDVRRTLFRDEKIRGAEASESKIYSVGREFGPLVDIDTGDPVSPLDISFDEACLVRVDEKKIAESGRETVLADILLWLSLTRHLMKHE